MILFMTDVDVALRCRSPEAGFTNKAADAVVTLPETEPVAPSRAWIEPSRRLFAITAFVVPAKRYSIGLG